MLSLLVAFRSEREPDRELDPRLRARSKSPRIRCPRCQWEHDGEKHWICDACDAIFDTFVTGAACPSCPQCWTLTQCPTCDELSPHENWYTPAQGPSA